MKTRIALTTLVWAGAFAVSAFHIYTVALANGNPWYTAATYPLTVDALILVCALTLTASRDVSKAAKKYAAGGRWFGYAATIYANVASGHYASTDAVIINLIPAVCLILVTQVFVHAARGTAATRATRATTKTTKLRAV